MKSHFRQPLTAAMTKEWSEGNGYVNSNAQLKFVSYTSDSLSLRRLLKTHKITILQFGLSQKVGKGVGLLCITGSGFKSHQRLKTREALNISAEEADEGTETNFVSSVEVLFNEIFSNKVGDAEVEIGE